MKPTTVKELIKKTAEELQLPEKMVEDVVLYYYKFIKKILSTLQVDFYAIKGLGMFSARYWKYFQGAQKCKAILHVVDPKKSIANGKIVDSNREKLVLLEKARERMKIKLGKKAIIKKINKEYDELVAKGINPKEKLEEDFRRYKEQLVSESLHREDSKRKVDDL